MPLTTTLPKRGPGPFSGFRHPKVTFTRLGSPVPVGVALSGTQDTLPDAFSLVKGSFSIHRVLPRTFSLRTGTIGSSTVRAHVFPERRVAQSARTQWVSGSARTSRPRSALASADAVRYSLARDLAVRCRCPRDHHHSVVHVAQPACTS